MNLSVVQAASRVDVLPKEEVATLHGRFSSI
jgi:hypothetical protein